MPTTTDNMNKPFDWDLFWSRAGLGISFIGAIALGFVGGSEFAELLMEVGTSHEAAVAIGMTLGALAAATNMCVFMHAIHELNEKHAVEEVEARRIEQQEEMSLPRRWARRLLRGMKYFGLGALALGNSVVESSTLLGGIAAIGDAFVPGLGKGIVMPIALVFGIVSLPLHFIFSWNESKEVIYGPSQTKFRFFRSKDKMDESTSGVLSVCVDKNQEGEEIGFLLKSRKTGKVHQIPADSLAHKALAKRWNNVKEELLESGDEIAIDNATLGPELLLHCISPRQQKFRRVMQGVGVGLAGFVGVGMAVAGGVGTYSAAGMAMGAIFGPPGMVAGVVLGGILGLVVAIPSLVATFVALSVTIDEISGQEPIGLTKAFSQCMRNRTKARQAIAGLNGIGEGMEIFGAAQHCEVAQSNLSKIPVVGAVLPTIILAGAACTGFWLMTKAFFKRFIKEEQDSQGPVVKLTPLPELEIQRIDVVNKEKRSAYVRETLASKRRSRQSVSSTTPGYCGAKAKGRSLSVQLEEVRPSAPGTARAETLGGRRRQKPNNKRRPNRKGRPGQVTNA